MDLCLVSSVTDFIAIQKPYCQICAERKLNCTIIRAWPIDKAEFKRLNTTFVDQWNGLKTETVSMSLRGCTIRCECSETK
jgi:hypothetical protein